MKKTLRILALLTALLMVAGVFAACGEKKSSSDSDNGSSDVSDNSSSAGATKDQSDPRAKAYIGADGEVMTRGNITILVPDGLMLKGGVKGSALETDPDFAKLTIDDKDSRHFLVTVKDSEGSTFEDIQRTRDANSTEDISFQTENADLSGCTYWQSDVFPRFLLGGTVNGRFVEISCSGFAWDSDGIQAVMESLRVSDGAGPVE